MTGLLDDIGRPRVMGVLNVTPDSFSDGGLYADPATAVAHARQLVKDGADLIDVGGESTRPGARRPSVDEEFARVIPVVEVLAADGIRVSVDTMRAEVAEAAVAAGAVLVNDVSGGLADEAMFATVARLRVPYVLTHWRAHSAQMQQHTSYVDVVEDVRAELAARLEAAARAGVQELVIDPGIGFSKTSAQNWRVLRRLDRFIDLGHPVLVATSRKRFLGELLADAVGDRPPVERDAATVATTTLAAAAGAWCVRVHDVRGSADAVRVHAAWADRSC